MTDKLPTSGLQLRSLIKAAGELEISLVDQPVGAPAVAAYGQRSTGAKYLINPNQGASA